MTNIPSVSSERQRFRTPHTDEFPSTPLARGRVTVISVTPNPRGGSVLAFATIQIDGAIEIHGVKVTQSAGKRACVWLPSTQSGGKWYPVVECTDPQLNQEISAVVLAAWEAKL